MRALVKEPNEREWDSTGTRHFCNYHVGRDHLQVHQVVRQRWLSSRMPVGAVADFTTSLQGQ